MTREGAFVMCRTCLNNSFPFSNIFKELLGEGYVYEVLMDVCQLEVSSDDGLPEYVCFDCHQNISKFHSFKLKTHEGNAALHRFKIKHEIKIEPVSCFTSSTPNNGSSLQSATRTMKECYVRLSRCDQLLQDGHSPKVNIKREKEDPSYLGDNYSGNIQGADVQVNIKSEKEDPSYLGDNYGHSNIQGADVQLPVALVGEGESLSISIDTIKQKHKEQTLKANTQSVVIVNEVLFSENLFSNGIDFEGDDIEIHEEKPYSEYASLIRDGDHPSDGADIEAEPQEFKETSENGSVTVDLNLKHCEGDPEEIISRLLERSVHRGVELNLDQSYEEKSLDDGGLKIQEREHLEEIQLESEMYEEKFEPEYTCRKPRDIYETRKVKRNTKNSLNDCGSSKCIDKRGLMRESDKETVKSDNVDSKTNAKERNLLEGSHVQLREEEENRDLLDVMVCDYCREEFHEKSDLLKHLAEHSGRSNFGRLLKKTNGKGNIVLFTSNSTKKRGSKKCKRSVRTKNQWKCKWCGKEFACASALKNHERVHTGEKPFSCKYCSRKFNIKWNLSQHELIHTGIMLHVCTYCSKKFRRKDILRQHELTHTGVKPFSCSYCSKTFNQKSNLNKHERIHTGVKPFSCSYCSKRFNQKSTLKTHELTHTGVKPFSCSYCSKQFNVKGNLTKHELIHTGEKPYMCEYCSKRFRHPASLKGHERIHTRVLSCS